MGLNVTYHSDLTLYDVVVSTLVASIVLLVFILSKYYYNNGNSDNLNKPISNLEEFVYMGRGQTIPKGVVSVRFDPSVTEVEREAFDSCIQLREVVLNDGLEKIGVGAFLNCTALQSITLPSTLFEIGCWAFGHCSNLQKVVLHEGLQKIVISAFRGCSSLESITLPSTLTDIGKFVFIECSNLREVELHENLQTIGYRAFHNCNSLERFTFPTISTRLNNVIEVETEVNRIRQLKNEIDNIRGYMIRRRGSELFLPGTVIRGGSNWNTIKASLDKIVSWIKYHEIKEGLTIFELALWKAKLDQVDDINPTSREEYRIEVPGPVKDTILQYLHGADIPLAVSVSRRPRVRFGLELRT